MNKIAQAAVKLFKQPLETTGYKYVCMGVKLSEDEVGTHFIAGHVEHGKNGAFFRKADTSTKLPGPGVFVSLPQAICILLDTNTQLGSFEILLGIFGNYSTPANYRYISQVMRDLRFLGFVKIERSNVDRRFRVYSLTPEMAECPLYKIYPPIYKNDQQ